MKSFALIGVVAVFVLVASVSASVGASGKVVGMPRSVDASVFQQKRAGDVHASFRSKFDCTAVGTEANVKLDCDTNIPNNEPHIAVDPANPQHMVASSNDYDSCCDEYYTTFDGGKTWSTGNMSAQAHATGSDPVTSFDVKSGIVIHASLNYFFTRNGETKNGDVVVSRSNDGGLNWNNPIVVAQGQGRDSDPFQIFNDKEWISTDNNPSSPFYGRTYLTWTAFEARSGNYTRSAIFEAHSDDAGRTWTQPQEISGSSAKFCTYQVDGPPGQCDEDQGSTIAIGPDGAVSVAFMNEQHQAAWEPGEVLEDQYLVVRSQDGGASWSPPVHVVDLEDGSRDYPINANGRQTLTGYQVRVWSPGNIAADPRTGALYLTFSDNRLGTHDVDNPQTDTKTFLMASLDGVHWAGPGAVDPRGGDQWFPWIDVNPVNGQLGILYNDRGHDGATAYHVTLATGFPGSLKLRNIATASSNPVNSAFFQAGIPGCEFCALFHGDYISVAYGSDGVANAVWTDMREPVDGSKRGEFIFYARVP
jgi:Neuraminidase (sialidase)